MKCSRHSQRGLPTTSLTRLRTATLLLLAILGSVPALAQVAKQGHDTLSALTFQSDLLAPSQPFEPLENVRPLVASTTQSGWDAFRLSATVEWTAVVDKRTGKIAFAEGGNIPWIPGRGNSLSMNDLAAFLKPGAGKIDLAAMETIARSYLPKIAILLGVDPKSLVLSRGRSGQPASHVWFVDFDVTLDGMVLEGARIIFRVNSGNLIQVGTENLPSPGAVVPAVKVSRDAALAAVAKYVGGFGSEDHFVDSGSLHLLPANVPNSRSAEGFAFGAGRGVAKVWELTFTREGVTGTWRARVDAATGALLELTDVNQYFTAQVTGGIYQNSPTTGSEVVRPMPFADAGGGYTNSAGLYNFTSATSSALNGLYVSVSDSCGSISQASDGSGNIAFGTSTGTDCATPGHGGAGNTHSAREQFYQVNRIKEIGRGWLPSNPWINQQLPVYVNLTGTCNAFWNGTSINFYQVFGTCGNTGEIAGVSMHEYGHGLDQNDGSGFDSMTSESYADITAALALHNSCIGPNFFGTNNCGAYGDPCTSCTGVRDIDYAKHSSGTPATVANYTQLRCGTGGGPCGGEVHCESYVPSEAIWDFANRDFPSPGTNAAWAVLDRLWYLSRSTSSAAFTCHTGGTYTSDGCGTGNWWKTMRAVDDDDGNLANGTPHGGALYAAFNRHGIACTTDTGANVTFAGCTAPTTPTLSVTAGSNSSSLSWTSSGAAVYDVFRNELGCNAGFARIATGVSGTSLTDTAVANGTTYYYQVTAYPSGNVACASAPSTCVSVTPVPPPTPVANFTFSCSVLACSFNGTSSTGTGLTYSWAFGDTGTGTGSTTSHTYGAAGAYEVTLTVTDSLGRQSSKSKKVSVTSDGPTAPAESYFTVAPCRILDTRNSTILTSGQLRTVQVAGNCGIPSTAKAVAFNVTIVSPTGPGHLVFFPGDQTSGLFPQATINFDPANSPRANNANLRLATNGAGSVNINPYVAASPGETHVILDVYGYFSEDTTPAPGAQGPFGFQTLTPCRIADTRTSTPIAVNTTRNFTVQGVCGVPVGAAAAALNLAIISPTAGGHAPLFQAGAFPPVPVINFNAGVVLANGARIGLAPTTPDVSVNYYSPTAGASTHALIDVYGYFKSDAPLKYRPITACRAVDTRFADQGGPAPLGAPETRNFQIQGNCGVPTSAKAVAVNITTIGSAGPGYLAVYPSGGALPAASYLNFDPSQGALGNGGIVSLSTLPNDLAVTSANSTHVIIDVFGYFQ